MTKSRLLTAIAIAAVTITTLTAGPAAARPAEPAGYTDAQIESVRTALVAGGASEADINAVLADPDALLAVPVSVAVDVTKGNNSRSSGVSTMALGTSCTGSSRWVTRTQYLRNLLGNELGRFVLRTDWCYNGARVTYSSSSATGTVTTLGNVGGLRYSGLTGDISEAWKVYNGMSNGEVRTQANGKFEQSPIRIGSIATVYPIAITNVRYNGTYSTGGSCNGCA